MKRIVHYLILAAVLVGFPLWCAWVGGYDQVLADVAMFPPQCEDWVSDSARLWRVKCPFNWWIFAAMGLCVAAAVWPFARRFCRALRRSRSLRPTDVARVGYPLNVRFLPTPRALNARAQLTIGRVASRVTTACKWCAVMNTGVTGEQF